MQSYNVQDYGHSDDQKTDDCLVVRGAPPKEISKKPMRKRRERESFVFCLTETTDEKTPNCAVELIGSSLARVGRDNQLAVFVNDPWFNPSHVTTEVRTRALTLNCGLEVILCAPGVFSSHQPHCLRVTMAVAACARDVIH